MAKYSKDSQEEVKEALHEMKEGKLTIGTSNKKVTSPKQAIAIRLSEAEKKDEKASKSKKPTKKS